MVRVYHKVKAERSGVRVNPTAAVYLGANYQINLGTGSSSSAAVVQVYTGTGSPEGVVTAKKGSIYNQFDANGNFIGGLTKTTDGGNTGWQ
jgi:hypothetical protein